MRAALNAMMRTARSLGARYADVRYKDICTERLTVEDGRVSALTRDRSRGYGVRVYVDRAMGFAASSDMDACEAVVRQAYDIARASLALPPESNVLSRKETAMGQYRTPVEIDPFTVPLAEKLALLFECDRRMRRQAGVRKTVAGLNFRSEDVYFTDTEGSEISQRFTQSGGTVRARAANGADTQDRSYGNDMRAGYEGVIALDLPGHAARAAGECVLLLSADPCPSVVADIILTPRQLFLQIHESVGHPAELDRVLGREAAFAGMSFISPSHLNEPLRYGSEYVSVVADPGSPSGLGTFGYDDEGVRAERTVLVDKGMFAGFLTSRDNAPVVGQASRGMGLSDGWRNLPIVRMTNINLLPGDQTLDALIGGISYGFILDENKSWSIDDKRVDFQFACEMAREIRNGRLTGRVFKNPIYSGKTTEFWGSCDGVCDARHWETVGVTNCGKGQPMQIMRVAHGSAPARFRKVRLGVDGVGHTDRG